MDLTKLDQGGKAGAAAPARAEAPSPEAPLLFDRPRRRAGCGVWTLVLLLLVAGGCALSWHSMDPRDREALQQLASDLLDGTPLDFLRTHIMPRLEQGTPPPPPINESGDHGVIPVAETPPPAPAAEPEPEPVSEVSGEVEAQAEPAVPAEEEEEIPLAQDERVTPAFVDDLAGWVVSSYRPGDKGGSLAVSAQALNQRYGSRMTGLVPAAGQGAAGRASLLRYAFTPSMVKGIYGMYADAFLRSVAAHASSGKSPLTQAQLSALYRALGARCTLLAGGVESVCALPDLKGRIRALDAREQAVTDANRTMLDAKFDVAQAKDGTQGAPGLQAAQAALDRAERDLQAATQAYMAEQRRLADELRRGGSAMGEDALLYLARWVDRRTKDTPSGMEAAKAAASSLRDLAGRCAKASREGPPAVPTRPVARTAQ